MSSQEEPLAKRPKTEDEQQAEKEEKVSDWPWRRAKKVALMLSFSGKDYLGMQR